LMTWLIVARMWIGRIDLDQRRSTSGGALLQRLSEKWHFLRSSLRCP
jgi:hypothetical protein